MWSFVLMSSCFLSELIFESHRIKHVEWLDEYAQRAGESPTAVSIAVSARVRSGDSGASVMISEPS